MPDGSVKYMPNSPSGATPVESSDSERIGSPARQIISPMESHKSERVQSPARQIASPEPQIKHPSPEAEAHPVPDAVIPTTVPMAVRHTFRRQDIKRAQLSSRRP